MSLNQSLIAELKQEMAGTRKILECVPADKKSWKPHEKSMTLERLAQHVAELPTWIGVTIDEDVLDFAGGYTPSPTFNSTEELVNQFDSNLKAGLACLAKASDEKFKENWTMRNGETIYFTLPKLEVLRTWVMNHNIHHRAQLGVYLRLLNIPLPSLYGPTADNGNM